MSIGTILLIILVIILLGGFSGFGGGPFYGTGYYGGGGLGLILVIDSDLFADDVRSSSKSSPPQEIGSNEIITLRGARG
jgi:Protein of unknown function (DUF3309)